MKYKLLKTDTFDVQFQKIVDRISLNFTNKIALKFVDKVEQCLNILKENPYTGTQPRYRVLKRQGYRVLVVPENLIFYKVNEKERVIILYAIVNDRQDYVKIIQQIG